MTADADASTRAARRGRSPFELLRFSATPVPGALVIVEIEGRVAAASPRFARRPVLVVEPSADRPRLELAPSRSTLNGDRWRAAYAIPAEAYDAARFALGLRGTLLDLPAPDTPDPSDRQTLLAREANALRRQLEVAEADAAAARAEATAAAGELGAAVSAARDEALAEAAQRISDLEHAVAEARRLAASDAAELRTAHEAALAEKDRALEEAVARHEAALAETTAAHGAADAQAQARALAAEEGIGVLRAELAEERERSQARIAELEQELVATTSRMEALRDDEDETQVLRTEADDDPDRTQVLGAVAEVEDTRSFTARQERGTEAERALPLERGALPRSEHGRGVGAYVAVGALVVFVLVLVVLLGFLG